MFNTVKNFVFAVALASFVNGNMRKTKPIVRTKPRAGQICNLPCACRFNRSVGYALKVKHCCGTDFYTKEMHVNASTN